MNRKVISSFFATALLLGIAGAASSCGGRNKYAYDLDFTEDVSGAKINMWAGFGSDLSDVLDAKDGLLREFERLTGVKVKYESKSDYNSCLKAVTLAATTGSYPHVVVGYPDHFASYVKANIIVRLDYYFENDIHNPTFEPEGERFRVDDFYADYMVENQSIEFDEDGNPYTLGIPFNKSTEVMVYNKTFFDFCASRDELKDLIYVPATYEQLEFVGQNILDYFKNNAMYGKVLGNNGVLYNDEAQMPEGTKTVINLKDIYEPGVDQNKKIQWFKPISYDSQANLFITTVRQNGGIYTEYDKDAHRGYINFDSQETRDGLSYLKGLYDNHLFGIPADWNEAKYGSNPFKANKTVMTIGSSAGVKNDIAAGGKFTCGVAPTLYRHADKKFVISQGANLALLDKGSRKQRVAAWQLIKFLTKYANGYFCAQTGYFPTCEYAELPLPGGTGESGMWANASDDFYDYATWYEGALVDIGSADRIRGETAKVNIYHYVNASEGWIKFVDPPFSGSADVRDAVAAICPAVFTGTSIDKAIQDVYEKLRQYVRS